MKKRIAELHLKKRKSFWILLVIELILLVTGIVGLFGKNHVYEFGPESMRINFGTLNEEDGSCYVDGSSGSTGDMAEFADISLPRGVYTVALRYETDTFMVNRCDVSGGTAGYKGLLTNGENCYPGISETGFNMWLLEDVGGISVRAVYGGQGSFSVSGLTVTETNALSRIWVFCVVLGSALVNLCYIYALYDRQFGISVKDKTVHFGLVLVVLFSSMPLMADYIANSGDLVYHLMRIEGIKDSILNGQFPNRIAPEWQQGYGYASPVFYGETLLYIAAFFRLVGFTVLTSYRMFFLLMNVANALTAYFCFKKIFEEKYIGLLCSALYTLSVYRIFKTYFTGSFGESFGVLFLPLLVYGFYRVFTQDTDSREYKRSWIPLTIGFSGLIQSHLLTCEMVGLFTIILCLVQIKRVFRKQTFTVLAKTVIYSCLLSAWFLVPFLDYMLTGNFVIQNVSERTIQYRGLYPAHLLFTFSISGSTTFYNTSGMYDSQSTNVGIALIVALILWLGMLFFRKTGNLKKEELGLGKLTAAFAVAAMCMSLAVFPWDRIQSLNGVTATLVSSLQFPSRFLSIANVMLTTLAGVVAKCVLTNRGKTGAAAYGVLMTVLMLVSNVWLLTYMTYDMRGIYLYNEEGMGSGYIGGAEYLPYGADASLFIPGAPRTAGNVSVEGYEKSGLTMDVNCSNEGSGEGQIQLPLLYYKGYRAWDLDTGERFETFAGDNFSVAVKLPGGYSGIVRTAFVSPVYWRIAEAVSVITFVLLTAAGAIQKDKEKKRGEERL